MLATTTAGTNITTKTTMTNYSTNTNTTVVNTDAIITHTANTMFSIWLTQPSAPTLIPQSLPASPPTHHTVTDTIITTTTSSRTGFESEPRQFLDL